MVLDVDESLRVCCMDFSDVISRLRACTPCLPRFRAGCEIRNRSKRRDFQKSALPKILLARSRGERSEPSLPSLRRANRNRICVMAAPKGPKTFATLEEAKADMKVLIEELLSNKEALLAIAADPENDTQQKKIAKLMPKLVQILGPKLVEKGFCAAPAQASMGACPDAQTPGWTGNADSFLSHTRTDGVCAWCGRDHDGGDGVPEGSGPGGGWRLRGWRGDQRRCEMLLDARHAAPVAGFCGRRGGCP